MSHNVQFSIIIPFIEADRLLGNCVSLLSTQIDSIGNDGEIICVCNQEYLCQSSFLSVIEPRNYIRLIHEPRSGSYNARNAGINEAKGKYLFFTDADCTPGPNWLRNGLERLTRGSTRICGPVVLTPRDANVPNAWELFDMVYGFPWRQYLNEGWCVTANLAVYRSVFESYGLFVGALKSGGDSEFGLRLSARGVPLVSDEEFVVYHPARASFRQHEEKTKRRAANWLDGAKFARKRSSIDICKLCFPPNLFLLKVKFRAATGKKSFKGVASVFFVAWLLKLVLLSSVARIWLGNLNFHKLRRKICFRS